MKRLTTFIFALFVPTIFFAQDVLVKTTGEKINCKIVDLDSALVSFVSADTTKKEVTVLPRQNLLALQQENNKMIFFFIPDTLIKRNGDKLVCKIIEIAPEEISFVPVSENMGDLTLSTLDNFSMIRFGNGSQEIIEQEVKASVEDSKSRVDYYQMGEQDAKKYFKTNGAAAGEFVCGMGTYFIGLGFIGGAIIYAVPPKNFNNFSNPNNHLLKGNIDYYEGYKDGATRKKHKNAAIGYASGVLAPIAIVVGAIAVASGSY